MRRQKRVQIFIDNVPLREWIRNWIAYHIPLIRSVKKSAKQIEKEFWLAVYAPHIKYRIALQHDDWKRCAYVERFGAEKYFSLPADSPNNIAFRLARRRELGLINF